MDEKYLNIGRWIVCFMFCFEEYDIERILSVLHEGGASDDVLDKAKRLMLKGKLNTGFTFTNDDRLIAVVVIGPASSGKEFIDTFVHEVHHLAVAIASNVGVELDSETPAYLSGDLAREMAEYICNIGCRLI